MSYLRKIDALIAEHVFGITPRYLENPEGRSVGWIDAAYTDRCVSIPTYSTDIALAIGVLEKAAKDPIYGGNHRWYVAGRESGGFSVWVAKSVRVYSCPIPEAICRHVLHVLGVPL